MKFILLTIVALCVSAFPYKKTIMDNLASNASAFGGALETANKHLAHALATTGACPCNVFHAYGMDQIPVFKQDFNTCSENPTTAVKCIVDKICKPFADLAGDACGGYFQARLSADDAALVNTLISACETLANTTIVINKTCTSENVTDYTVFAVNANLSDDLVQYHVIKNAYTVSTLPSKIFVESMFKDHKLRTQYVEIVKEGTTVSVANDFVKQLYANVTHTFAGSNGYVHMLSSHMSLPLSPSATISQLPALSNLSASITAEKLTSALDDMDSLTLLAPANSGFEAFPFFGNLSDQLRNTTIESHLIPGGVFFSPEVLQSDGTKLNTSSGLELQIQITGTSVTFVSTVDGDDYTGVVTTDIVTSNGVIHVVNDVLRPILNTQDNNIVDNMILDERLAEFTSLIANSAPEFLAKLRSAKNITLFAPQNLSTKQLEISQVEALLDYHTLETEFLSTSLSTGKNLVSTALDDEEYVRLDGANQSLFVVYTPASNTSGALVQLQSSYAANNVNVTFANLKCQGNNVIHIVSAPATVPTSTISTLRAGGFEFLGDSFGNNTEFAKMIDGHVPNKFNNQTEIYTVFAAADSAYSSLSAEPNVTGLASMQDQVIPGPMFSAHLIALLKQNNNTINFTMLSGRSVDVELRGDDVYVAGWKVITTDILTANGVVHVLEGAVGTSATKKSSTDGLSAGVLAAIIVGGFATLGLFCYCFFMKGEDGTAEEKQGFARIP